MQLILCRVHRGDACSPFAQQVPLLRLSHIIRFSSNHNTRWQLIKNYNQIFIVIKKKLFFREPPPSLGIVVREAKKTIDATLFI